MTETQQQIQQQAVEQTQPEPKQEDYKMVFCVRNDLKMGKGKIAA